ncbi:MAG: pentapeptide repeat-containing protein [Deltaproteobacteria bacterium]
MSKKTILIFAFAVILLGFLLAYVPKWQVHDLGIEDIKERITLENELRGNLTQILGWALIGLGLYYVIRRIVVAEKAGEVAKQGQITERFTRAISQLGAIRANGQKRLEIRVGGIYGLEGIARESPEYYWPVMEILTAYVRENAPWQETVIESKEKIKIVAEHGKTDPLSGISPRVPADIQAVLTVLGRRALSYRSGEEDRLNLAQTNLYGVSLGNANLEGALLFRANFQKAVLTKSKLASAVVDESHLQEANLNYANLQRGSLKRANLQRASLMGANLQHARLSGTALQGADLRGIDLRGADLGDANLEGANLQKAKLKGAILRGANLLGANLEGADLEGADLRVADLREARLQEATLWKAMLQGANLLNASLEGANLKGADLSVANLREAYLQEANLEKVNLEKANLQNAHLEGANLKKAKGVPAAQLSKAETLYAVKLESQLKKKIREDYPHLLEKP